MKVAHHSILTGSSSLWLYCIVNSQNMLEFSILSIDNFGGHNHIGTALSQALKFCPLSSFIHPVIY